MLVVLLLAVTTDRIPALIRPYCRGATADRRRAAGRGRRLARAAATFCGCASGKSFYTILISIGIPK